jgi:hypothetical protein
MGEETSEKQWQGYFGQYEIQWFNGVVALFVQLKSVFSKSKSRLLLLNLWLQHKNYGSYKLKSVVHRLTKQHHFVVSTERRSYHVNKHGLKPFTRTPLRVPIRDANWFHRPVFVIFITELDPYFFTWTW